MRRVDASAVAVVTIVHGRHEHLGRQRDAVAALDPSPLAHVVVSMGDPGVAEVMGTASGVHTVVEEIPAAGCLPLAAARNQGVGVAARLGAAAVALLDVDCIPHAGFVADHAAALSAVPGSPAVVCGRVKYLPPGMGPADYSPAGLARLGEDHPARVVPPTDHPVPGEPTMLWSLNLGMRMADWYAVGGFDEAYVGYGGEDTDFGQRVRAAGGGMWWSRGAVAYHQHHDVERPPLTHLADIVRNANLFHERWGWYPMEGWLTAFEERGLARRHADGWQVSPGQRPDLGTR